ncbi:DUF1499 domain-containing protein (plasmid) [Pseudorhodobacter turbinis]|uniref:DUF1499 domain-containing protein n=1 Tax=Pseudorhodobacter turbinis TaxID=2500533 RepID=A0A4P8EIB9_9RHOB|nr:DUF1499 domain-containing protein [Pseudorhodobacter turbinis]QCO56707.1 DUF1499 domain-containing protein [Pseudorhodobacter turbinis]
MTIAAFLLVLAGLFGYIRFAPSDVARWHIDPASSALWPQAAPLNDVQAQIGSATLYLPDASLAQVDAIAIATPHTTRLAGNVDEGRITWITRSALWGFPDYITAQAGPDGVRILGRLRFGKSDMGVNAARLREWQSKL